MTNSPLTDAERNLLAAEYALGLLEGAEHVEAERLYHADPAFANEADRWIEEGSGWIEDDDAAGPSSQARRRIAAGFGIEETADAAQEVNLPFAGRGPGIWRPFALAASLAAISFAGLWLFDRPSAPSGSIAGAEQEVRPLEQDAFRIAQISSENATSLVTALYDNDTGILYLRLSDIPDPDRVPQLWLLDSTGTPRSLGFGTRDANSEIVLSSEQRRIAEEGGTLAISLEEPASTPHELPSDVLGIAQLASLDIN